MDRESKKIKLDDSVSIDTARDHSILHLTDDCIYQIFSYLSLVDLCRIGLTCIRLNNIAQHFYSRHAATVSVNTFGVYHQTTVKMVLEQIGNHVKSFHISKADLAYNGYNYSAAVLSILKLILQYCPNLSEFKCDCKLGKGLDDFWNEPDYDAEFTKLFKSHVFQNLQSIHLYFNSFDAFETLVAIKNLKKFEFKSDNGYIISTDHLLKLGNLDSLCLDVRAPLDYNMYSQIFDNNLELQKLRLGQSLNDENILNLIFDKLTHLIDFDMSAATSRKIPKRTMMRIAEIQNLKHLCTDWIPSCVLEKLAFADQLETLDCIVDSSGEIIKFTKLKYLSCRKLDDAALNSLKSQCSLEKLNLDHNGSLITEGGLLKFISGAVNLIFLSICGCEFGEQTLRSLNGLIEKYNRDKLTVRCNFLDDDYDSNDYQKLIILLNETESDDEDSDEDDCNYFYDGSSSDYSYY